MAIINGTANDDWLNGTSGNDTIYGGAGNDDISGGDGDDILYGEAGDDTLNEFSASSDQLYGGAGNDVLNIGHYSGIALADGGIGDDLIRYWQLNNAAESTTLIGGDGNDIIDATSNGLVNIAAGTGADLIKTDAHAGQFIVNTGAGSDVIQVNIVGSDGIVTVTDFTAGDSGDKLYLSYLLQNYITDWNVLVNPFASGHFRLVQSGADTILQFNSGASYGSGIFRNIVVLNNVAVNSLTAANLGGFAPDGYIPATATYITGTADADGLVGTQRADVIHGGAGGDTILSSYGSDYLFGEDGNDYLDGGDGDDTITGGEGDDILIGLTGNDTLRGDNGDDDLNAGKGNDILYGGNDADTLTSEHGGNDKLYGEAGNDTISVRRGNHTLDNGTNNIILIDGGDDNDDITYYSSHSQINNSDIVTIHGGTGNDHIMSHGGKTVTIDAGSGNDDVEILITRTNTVVTLGAGQDEIGVWEFDSQAQWGIVTVTDFVSGANGDIIDPYSLLSNFSGYETKYNPFATGHLRLVQSGADTYLQVDRDGNGTTYGLATLIILKNVTASTLTGENFTSPFYHADHYDIFPNAIRGTSGDNQLYGTSGADALVGFEGNDTLDGRAGADEFYGGLGDDRYFIDNVDDWIVEFSGQGTDTVITSVSYQLGYDMNIEKLYALDTSRTTHLQLTGNQINQQIIGNAGNNVIDGKGGADEMQGMRGNDTYYVDNNGDTVIEAASAGTDMVYSSVTFILGANVENLHLTGSGAISAYGSDGYYTNIITGNSGNNYIYGRGGADYLYGNSGNDTIRGGTERDVMYGDDDKGWYTGADIFEFYAPDFSGTSATTADRIADFDTSDRIDLSKVDAVTGGADNAFAFIGSGAFTGVAGQLRYEYVSGSTAVQGDMNGDGIADFWIMLDGTHALTTGQFIL